MNRIFFVIRCLQYGGAERVMCEIARFLEEKGYEVTIITFIKAKKEYILNDKIERVNLNVPEKGIKKLMVGRRALKRYLLKENAKICISFDILANILLILSAPKKCIKIISERNAPKQTELSAVSKVLRFLTYGRCDYCVFQTDGARKCYSKKIQKKGLVIPNPVKENLPFKKSIDTKKEIVAIGRLENQKNYPAMIRGFEEFVNSFPEYTLKIYGDGSKEKELIDYICEKNLRSRVNIEHSCPDIHSRISDSEMFIMTSNYEGIPNALLEAMAMGFPVVAYDCPPGGCAVLVEHEVNGILLKSQEAGVIAGALKMLAEDRGLRERLGNNARQVRSDFSLDKIGGKWLDLIDGLKEESA